MTLIQTICPNNISLHIGKQGAHSGKVGALTSVFEKSARELKPKPKQKLLRCKSTVHIVTLNVRTLNRIGQLPELTASVAEYNVDIVCIQEHRYYHCEVKIKYHNSSNGWTFISASGKKNSVNAIIGRVGMLLSPCALKLLNSIKKIQPRITAAAFSDNPSTTIISYYNSSNASNETDLITFYNELSSLVSSIL